MLTPVVTLAPLATACPTSAAGPLQPAGTQVPASPFSLNVPQHIPKCSPFQAGSTQAALPFPAADRLACSAGLPAGRSVQNASSHHALSDRSGALRWLHGWAALASGEVEPSIGPVRAPPSAPCWAAPAVPAQRAASICSPCDSGAAHSMLSGQPRGSLCSLAPSPGSPLQPASRGGHPDCHPVAPLTQLPSQRRKRQAARAGGAERNAEPPVAAARQQKRTRAAATVLAPAGEPMWAANLTRALHEAATAMR